MINAVTVYCSSSSRVPRIYFDAAEALGAAIAREKWKLVYGGNAVGLMGALADAVRGHKGQVIGITPQVLVEKGISDEQCDELIVTTGMRERKALLEERGDAFIALPGGLGTFEEIFEIIVGRQLGCHSKPIVLLNVNRYYDPLLAMLQHGVEQGFIRVADQEWFHQSTNVAEAIDYLKSGRGADIQQTESSTQIPSSSME
jgi:uncharacterized protein (TIGR00730 family)